MEQALQSLVELLRQELAIYETMAELLGEEREALASLAADRLGELTARKETLVLRVKALDESRRLLARRLAAAAGVAPDDVTVSKLIEVAPPNMAAALADVAARLRDAVRRCRELNDMNARAAARGAELVAGAVRFLVDQAEPSGRVYQDPRRMGAGSYPRATPAPGMISRSA